MRRQPVAQELLWNTSQFPFFPGMPGFREAWGRCGSREACLTVETLLFLPDDIICHWPEARAVRGSNHISDVSISRSIALRGRRSRIWRHLQDLVDQYYFVILLIE